MGGGVTPGAPRLPGPAAPRPRPDSGPSDMATAAPQPDRTWGAGRAGGRGEARRGSERRARWGVRLSAGNGGGGER